MSRFYIPTLGPTDWRRLLADPATQWRRTKSAFEMAVCWEAVRESERGLPPEVATALDSVPSLAGASLVFGVPEHKVYFEGGGHPSQNDLWGLLRVSDGLVSFTIEAKAGEKLDDLVSVWLTKKARDRTNKPERLAALQQLLGIPKSDVAHIRYQLLHRSASALKEAERCKARYALVLVQSFNREADEQSWKDFSSFAQLMGTVAVEGSVVPSLRQTVVPLLLGWVTSRPATPELCAAAV